MARLNLNLTGHQITDEKVYRTSAAAAGLVHDTILDVAGLEIRTAASGGGTLLTETTDYVLGSKDTALTTAAGADVWTTLAIVNGTYQNTTLYITYKTVGDYAEADDVTPVGAVTMFAGATAPGGWLLCDGSAVNRITYQDLFAVISTTFGVGDGSTTFNLPDFREAAPTGVGTRAAGVTAHDAFTLAQFKDDAAQGHMHNVYAKSGNNSVGSGTGSGGLAVSGASLGRSNSATDIYGTDAYKSITTPIEADAYGAPRLGTVTRGKRLGINFIIKCT